MTIAGATISGATITGAVVAGATISGANLSLSGATVSGATISGASVSKATLTGSTISGGAISEGTITQGSISGGNISGGAISAGTISAGTVTGGTISGGTISGTGAPATTPAGQSPPERGKAPNAQPGERPPETQPVPPAGDESPKRPARPGHSPQGRRKSDRPGQRAAAAEDDDEEDLAARALQQALVQRGALLLPIWGLEIAPSISYGHISQDTVITVAGPSPGDPATTVGLRRRSHQVSGALTARLGLPFDLQIEASEGGQRVWNDEAIAGAARNDAFGFGLGDPRFTLTWQMIHAGSWAPDVFLAGTWKPQIGSSPFEIRPGEVAMGTGYTAVGGTITAVKTSDPLVFLASAAYTANLGVDTPQGRRDPGDLFGAGGGVILAVSPETSLSFLLDFHYKPEDTLKDKSLVGTDETVAVLQLGLGQVLSRRLLMNVSVGVGLTSDSPNFQLAVSLPMRF